MLLPRLGPPGLSRYRISGVPLNHFGKKPADTSLRFLLILFLPDLFCSLHEARQVRILCIPDQPGPEFTMAVCLLIHINNLRVPHMWQ